MKKPIQEIRAEAELPLNLSQLPIRVTLDIPYCIDGNPAHTLDIALPAQGAGPFPAVVSSMAAVFITATSIMFIPHRHGIPSPPPALHWSLSTTV